MPVAFCAFSFILSAIVGCARAFSSCREGVGWCWLEVAWEGVLFFLFFDMFERRITREREREREGGLELEQI